MKLGVFTPVLYGQPLEKALEYLHSRGVQMAEIGVGGNPGDTHCKPKELLADSAKLAAFQELFRKNEIEISALSAHGNPIHPNPELAAMYDDAITDAAGRKTGAASDQHLFRMPRRSSRREVPELGGMSLARGFSEDTGISVE